MCVYILLVNKNRVQVNYLPLQQYSQYSVLCCIPLKKKKKIQNKVKSNNFQISPQTDLKSLQIVLVGLGHASLNWNKSHRVNLLLK